MMIVAWARGYDSNVYWHRAYVVVFVCYDSNEQREEVLSKKAIKYFVLGSFASAILIYGMAFIYGAVRVPI